MSSEKFNKQNLSVRLDTCDIDDINYLIEQSGIAFEPTMSQKELLRIVLSAAVNRTKPKVVSQPEDLAKIEELNEIVNLQTTNIEEKDKAIKELTSKLESLNASFDELDNNNAEKHKETDSLLFENNQLKQKVDELTQLADNDKQQIEKMLQLKPTDMLLKDVQPVHQHILLQYCQAVSKRKEIEFTPTQLLVETIFIPWIKGNAFDFRDKLGLRIPTSEIKKIEEYFSEKEVVHE